MPAKMDFLRKQADYLDISEGKGWKKTLVSLDTFLVDGSLPNADVDLMVDDRVAVGNRVVLEIRPKLFDHFQEFPVGPSLVHIRLLL